MASSTPLTISSAGTVITCPSTSLDTMPSSVNSASLLTPGPRGASGDVACTSDESGGENADSDWDDDRCRVTGISSGAGVRSGIGSLPVLDVVDCNGEVEIPVFEVVRCRGDVKELDVAGGFAMFPGLDVRCKGEVGVLTGFDVVAKKASVRGVNETGARGGGGGGGLRRT